MGKTIKNVIIPEEVSVAIYSDTVSISTNRDGLIISFFQTLAPSFKENDEIELKLLFRVQMGWEHFKSHLSLLQTIASDYEKSKKEREEDSDE